MRSITKLLSATAVAAALAAVAAPASATVYIAYSINGGAISQLTSDPTDASYSGAAGAWDVNVISNVNGTYPVLFTSSDHNKNCVSGADCTVSSGASTTNPGVLDIFVTRDDNWHPGATSIFSSFGTNVVPAGWSVQFRSYLDLDNQKPGDAGFGATLLSDHTFTAGGFFSETVNSPNPGASNFSVIGRYTITPAASSSGRYLGAVENNITIQAVPEPGTWALMIAGFGGAGAMLRTRRRALSLAA